MKTEKLTRIRSALEPRWDEVREQRVLARIVDAKRHGEPRGRTRFAIPAAAALVALVALFVFVSARGHGVLTGQGSAVTIAPQATPNTDPVGSPTPATSALPAGASPDPQSMMLADGSKAFLLRKASLQVDEQSTSRVHITQSTGSVRYDVVPDVAREFLVQAVQTTIRVRGTIFIVDVDQGAVDVRVERGRVEVQHGSQTHNLVAGEALHVAEVAATDDADPSPPSPSASAEAPASVRPTPEALLERADNARRSGNSAEAVSALEMLVSMYPRDPRAASAIFTLGRVYRAVGRRADSAAAFERCASGGGPLAHDALAEAAISWASAGRRDAAKRDAETYLKRYPNGGFAGKMRDLSE